MKTYVIELPTGELFRVDLSLKSQPATKYITTEQTIYNSKGDKIQLQDLDDNLSFMIETEIRSKLNDEFSITY